MIHVVNRRRKEETIRKQYPNAIIIDVTSKSDWAQPLSPFFPHGGIPIPNSNGLTGASVEGIWQGLKVFEGTGVSRAHLQNTTMKGLKRTVRTNGKPLGHQYGMCSKELLNYLEARVAIYLPAYKWVLSNVPSVVKVVKYIKAKSKETDVVLLDYNTNEDYTDLTTPLSHAALVKLFIEGNYPDVTLEDLRKSTEKS